MRNYRKNKNRGVSRILVYKPQEQVVSSKKQILSKGINSLPENAGEASLENSKLLSQNALLNLSWSLEEELLTLYLHKKYKNKQIFNQSKEQISAPVQEVTPMGESFTKELTKNLSNQISSIKKSKDNTLVKPNLTVGIDKSIESQFEQEQDTSEFFDIKLEKRKLSKKRDFLNFLFNFKQIASEYFGEFLIRPTRLTLLFSSFFYFIAIWSTFERRANNNSLSILLQSKIPGYATLYQNNSWESFENLTSKYLLLNTSVKPNAGKPLKSFTRVKTDTSVRVTNKSAEGLKALPLKGRASLCDITPAEYKNSVSGYVNDIKLSKDRACFSTRSPWNKQLQKDFRAFFLDTSSLKDTSLTEKSFIKTPLDSSTAKLSKIEPNREKRYILPPWYKIDACALASDFLVANRENSDVFDDTALYNDTFSGLPSLPLLKKPVDTPVERESGQTEISNSVALQRSKNLVVFHSKTVGLEYLFPWYKNKEQVFLENDSIPSKCNSFKVEFTGNKLSLDSGHHLIPSLFRSSSSLSSYHPMGERGKSTATKGKVKKRVRSKRLEENLNFDENYLASFQRIMKEFFYANGLVLFNFAGTTSQDSLFANMPHGVFSPSQTLRVKKAENIASIKLTKRQKQKHLAKNFKRLIWLLLEPIQQDSKQLLKWEDLKADNYPKDQRESYKVRLFMFTQLFGKVFRENKWNSMRHVSGYKFPDLNAFSVICLFKQFAIPRVLSGSFSFYSLPPVCLGTEMPSLGMVAGVKWGKPNKINLGKASRMVNQVLLIPFRVNVPPALPFCYFKNLLLTTYSFDTSPLPPGRGLAHGDPNIVHSKNNWNKLPLQALANHIDTKQEERDTEKLKIVYKGLTLPELTEIKKLFEKVGLDYQDYLKQPKEGRFALLLSKSIEDDEALKNQDDRKSEQADKKKTPFQLLQQVRKAEEPLEKAKDLHPFTVKDVLAFQSVAGDSDFTSSNRFSIVKPSLTTANKVGFLPSKTIKFETKLEKPKKLKFSEFFKASFFGEMSLLPKFLVAKDQKEIKEQLLNPISWGLTNPVERKKSQDRVPDFELREQENAINFIDLVKVQARHNVGAKHRTVVGDLKFSLKTSNKNKRSAAGHKRKLTSTLFVAPSQRHILLPQISVKDWKKILEWQLKRYIFDEQKRLQSLREAEPEREFKMQKLTIYLPWVTFRTSLNKAFEWPLTRLDFTEFVPTHLTSHGLFLPKAGQPDYLIPAQNASLALTRKSRKLKESKAEELISRRLLLEALTNKSYLLIYRLFLFFLFKSVLQYIYRFTVRPLLIHMSYSDYGLATISPEFREWLEDRTPKTVYKVEKSLKTIGGIEENLSTISQIIWHLRNFGRSRHNIPAVLLLGPKNTEKTSLVQAIASEAKVGVVVQPLEGLLSSDISPYDRLEEIFLLARKEAPCILFLDSLDWIGKSRRNVVSNYAGDEDSLFCLDSDIAEGKHEIASLSHSLHTNLLINKSDPSISPFDKFAVHTRSGNSRGVFLNDALPDLPDLDQHEANQNIRTGSRSSFAFYQEKTGIESVRIKLLLRLLAQIDGISPLKGVVVMATSSESATLDPALLRPGRFRTILKLSLPDKATRLQLLKIESQKLGSSPSIPWEYLATRTSNMSGPDILSAINHSAIRAILDNTVHTVESLEHGLNRALALPKSKKQSGDLSPRERALKIPFQTSRLAFSQAGKVVLQNLLVEYPKDAFFELESEDVNTEQKNNLAAQQDFKLVYNEKSDTETESGDKVLALPKQISSIPVQGGTLTEERLKNTKENIRRLSQIDKGGPREEDSEANTFLATTRTHFHTRLVALYAGKAAELLHFTCFSSRAKDTPSIDPLVNSPIILQNRTTVKKFSVALQKATNLQSSAKNWESNLAFSDLLIASSLIHTMIDRWYLYSQKLFTFKSNQVLAYLNYEQLQEERNFVLFHKLTKQVYSNRAARFGYWTRTQDEVHQTTPSTETDELFLHAKLQQSGHESFWWYEKMCQELEMMPRPYGIWYRLYLPNPEEHEQRNDEWVPPDLIFNDFSPLSNLMKKDSTHLKTLHDLYLFERDSAYYNVVMNCFYKAFNLLSQNRELVDFLADHFIRFKILRSPEMSTICSLFLHEL